MPKKEQILYGAFVGRKFGLTYNLESAIEQTKAEMVKQGTNDGEIRSFGGPADDYPSFDAPTFRLLSDRIWPTPEPAEASWPIAINYLHLH